VPDGARSLDDDGCDPNRRSSPRTRWVLPALVVPFIFLATLNSAGYRYGASDLAFYVPAALVRINPALYPRDAPLIASQARLTTFDEVMGVVARATHAPLPILLAAMYCLTLALFAGALWLIAARVYRTTGAAAALIAAMSLRHAIARSGTNTLEGYFHPRQLAFALGSLALAGFLRKQRALPALLILAAGLLHPTTALWFAVWLGVATVVEDRGARVPLAVAAAAGAVLSVWLLTAGPLGGRLTPMDQEWLATLETKDYLFPLGWPLEVWILNLSYIPIIIALYRRRRASGVLVPGETGMMIGCLSLVLVFAAVLPFNAARVALAVQLQSPRIFWMLDLLATLYVVWALAEGMAGAERRAWTTAAIVAAVSLARGSYVLFVKFPERPVVQLRVPDNDWGRAMAWARTTAPDSGWLADPMHAIKYGTSVRVAGERDVFVEAVKDAAIGMYERGVAIRTRDHLARVQDFNRLTPADARSLGAEYNLDFLVTERALELPLAFESGALRVYRLK
jgi:hypothetical protein